MRIDKIDVGNLADEAALAFIQGNSEKFRALVRAFIAAYEAGKSSGYEQAREDSAKVCQLKADSLRLGAMEGIEAAYAEDIELCQSLKLGILSLKLPTERPEEKK